MTEYTKALNSLEQTRPSVIRHKKKVIRTAIIKTLILEAAAIAIPLLLLKNRTQVMLTVMAFGAIAYPLLWVKPHKIIRVPYVGRIERTTQVQKRVSVGGAASSFYTSMRDAIFIQCTVKDDHGKTHVFELPATYGTVYQQGDKVLNTTGIRYPIPLSAREQTVCPCCGSITPSGKQRCIACHFDMKEEKGSESC